MQINVLLTTFFQVVGRGGNGGIRTKKMKMCSWQQMHLSQWLKRMVKTLAKQQCRLDENISVGL